jgi:hypothetical protein
VIVIAHFYNEQYLLPFWLKHHKKIFDHGILIDSNSTDKSVEIIQKIVPDWEIVKSPTELFDSEVMENFIMQIESKLDSEVKIVLNISEFLFIENNNKFEKLISLPKVALWMQAAMMVDLEPAKSQIEDLLSEKYYGFWHTDINIYKMKKFLKFGNKSYRERLIHNYSTGEYFPGRHKSKIENTKKLSRKTAYIRWYNFSPWNKDFIERKLSFASTFSKNDTEKQHGIHHLAEYTDIKKLYDYYKNISYPIPDLKIKSYLLSIYHVKVYPLSFIFRKYFNKLLK